MPSRVRSGPSGCQVDGCSCPAPGLRTLANDNQDADQDDDLEEDVTRVITAAAARRQRTDDHRALVRAAIPPGRGGAPPEAGQAGGRREGGLEAVEAVRGQRRFVALASARDP
jgi:hypothetical protein